MAKIVNEQWKADLRSALLQNQPIDVTSAFRAAIQWLVVQLSNNGKPYKLHNLGAGVIRITTETTKCPCCGKTI
jgi:hypothetical protein